MNLIKLKICQLSPSGHIYEREVIIEYLLSKTRELKQKMKLYLEEQVRHDY